MTPLECNTHHFNLFWTKSFLNYFSTVTNENMAYSSHLLKPRQKVIKTLATVSFDLLRHCWDSSPVQEEYFQETFDTLCDKGITIGPKWCFSGKWLLFVTLSPPLWEESIDTHLVNVHLGELLLLLMMMRHANNTHVPSSYCMLPHTLSSTDSNVQYCDTQFP